MNNIALKDRHLVLAGINIRRERGTGDKNFWSDILPHLAGGYGHISIFSIRKDRLEREIFKIGQTTVEIRFIAPVFLESSHAEYDRPRIFWRNGIFPSRLGVIEKVFSGIRIFRQLRKLYRVRPYQRLHLMDNFGLFNRFFIKVSPAATSVSAIAYQGWTSSLYDRYLSLSYNHPDLEVIAYSLALSAKLRSIGIIRPSISHIHWGVNLPGRPLLKEEKTHAKKELSLPIDRPLFLWAGYIQQIKREDFFLAVRAARAALNNRINAIFYFAFKPETMEEDIMKNHDPSAGIFIKATSVEEFNLLKSAADVFYSPLSNESCIVAPPLTWLELLSLGVPILTTNAGGVEEAVVEERTGYIAQFFDDLVRKIFIISERNREMASDCHHLISNSYNLADSAKRYIEIWQQLGFNNPGLL